MSTLMKALILLLLLAFVGIGLLTASAQQPAEYLLSAEEKKAWADYDADEVQLSHSLGKAVSRAINTPVGADSIEVHGAISQAGLALDLVRARRVAFLAQLQAREGCRDCRVEAGKLVPPKEAKK